MGRQVKSVKPVEQALVRMVNKTDKHKNWLATRPTSLSTDMTLRRQDAHARCSRNGSSVRLGAERAGGCDK